MVRSRWHLGARKPHRKIQTRSAYRPVLEGLRPGAATVVVGPTGNTVSLSLPNSAQDLCPVLAAL